MEMVTIRAVAQEGAGMGRKDRAAAQEGDAHNAPEPAAASRLALHHDARGNDVPEWREHAEEVSVRHLVGDVEDEQVGARGAAVGVGGGARRTGTGV